MAERLRPEDNQPMLGAIAGDKAYPGGVTALDGASLEVAVGETLALVGESGPGKSTLLGLFNRTVDPDVGQVAVDGRPVADRGPVELRRRIGYVPQNGGILSGALPAAPLAVAVDFALGRLERAVRPPGLEAS